MSTVKLQQAKENEKENLLKGQGKDGKNQDGDSKRKEPVWQYKPIVLKKSKPDPVLTSFFTVVKSKKATHHHNHQGFPKKQCWLATNLDDYYYVNPEYVENFPMVEKMYREDGVYFPYGVRGGGSSRPECESGRESPSFHWMELSEGT